jgi:UDP-GlcNAc:undecaprenyl-phosphate GlcNAc-1-phosphate transferase
MLYSQILLAVFLLALFTSTAAVKRLSRLTMQNRRGDEPRNAGRRGIPRVGGAAVVLAVVVAIGAALILAALIGHSIPKLPELVGALAAGSAILFVVGLLDDIRGVRPFVKVIAQTAAALIVYFAGFHVTSVSFIPGYASELGWLSLPVTVVWLVGVSNAFNLIDGLDGLAAGVALISLPFIVVAALVFGHQGIPLYALALAGALVGFLRFNFPPARIFLGDSGSLVVGFLLAVFAAKGATSLQGVTYAVIPIFALSYLLLDTGIAILRRWLRGVPLSRGDRRHIHHQLASLGLQPRRALLVIYGASAGLGGMGLLAAFAPPAITSIASLIGFATLVVVIARAIYWLEYHEFIEAGSSIASAARNARSVIRDKINARDVAHVIRRAESRAEVEQILAETAALFRFAQMKLSDSVTRDLEPGRLTSELQALRLWKLDYPILCSDAEQGNDLCLTIWSSITARQRPAGPERVAQILAPAIAICMERAALVEKSPVSEAIELLTASADSSAGTSVPAAGTAPEVRDRLRV